MKAALRLVAGLLTGLAICGVSAQEWPSRAVTIVYPWPPGGGTDRMTRLVADRLSKELGQPFILDSRPGASGTIGSDIAAKAAPDGYTLLLSGLPSHVIAPAYAGAPFDPMRDFTHIALLGGSPLVLAVHPGLAAKTLREFVDLSRSRKEGIAWASAGTGSFVHLMGERFRQASNGNLLHVAYKGLPPIAADLIAGHVPSAFMTLATTGTLHRGGKVRLLAITTSDRVADYPEVPTFSESGYSDFVATTWFSVSGPPRLPEAIVARLNREIRAALAAPAIAKQLASDGIGIEPRDLTPKAFSDYFQREIERWAPLARAAKSLEPTK